jgi:shikimate dehydrogenase
VSLTVDEVACWAGEPLILFLGVSTSGSVAHAVFDRWAAELGRPWALWGVDLPASAPPGAFRRLVSAMRGNPAVDGAVVTAHKLRLYRACAQDLARRDWLTEITHEINALATTGVLAGYARDALSLARILPGLIRSTAGDGLDDLHVLCLGAGGAATALLLALHLDTDPERDGGAGGRDRADPPASVTFTDVDPRALADLRSVAGRAGIGTSRLSFVRVRDPADSDALVSGLPSPGFVINATGLGKDAAGSPVTGRARFGPGTLAWDLNYRGDLAFLRQAAASGATALDGWDYFVAGWAGGLTAIAQTPFTGDLLTRFAQAAAPLRPAPWHPPPPRPPNRIDAT